MGKEDDPASLLGQTVTFQGFPLAFLNFGGKNVDFPVGSFQVGTNLPEKLTNFVTPECIDDFS